MSSLNLRWVEGEADTTRRELPLDVVDSLTIIVGVSRIVEDKWEELTDTDRKELARMLRRRADRLMGSLADRGHLRL